MERYRIEYKETAIAYFEVEAENQDEALARFEEWRIADPHVFEVISHTDNLESDAEVVYSDYGWDIDEDDVLTDEMYRDLP